MFVFYPVCKLKSVNHSPFFHNNIFLTTHQVGGTFQFCTLKNVSNLKCIAQLFKREKTVERKT